MLTHPERSSVPIYIAALGPKSVEGAAEYADGWLPFLYSPEGAAQVWGDALAAGHAKRAPTSRPLEISAGGMVAIGEDVKGLLDFARPMFALYIGGMGARGKNFYNDLACQYGYEAEAKEIQDLYLDGKKKEAEAAVPARAAGAGQPRRPGVLRQGADRGLPRVRRDQPPGRPGQRRPGGAGAPAQGMGS